MMFEFKRELPDPKVFYDLFQTTGWKMKFTVESLFEAISNSWYIVSVYENEKLIGFGRIVSDGVYQAMICDLIVRPEDQGKGLGGKILIDLLKKCDAHSMKMVVLMSAKGKTSFYKKYGFKERDSESPGMQWTGRFEA